MATYEILLAIPDEEYPPEDQSSVDSIVKDMDAAINDVGLFSGNFLVRKLTDDTSAFWKEWTKRMDDGA